MHQDYIIILQLFFGAIDRIDIVGSSVLRVVDKSKLHRQMKRITIVNKNLVVITSGHYNFLDSERSQHPKLTAQNSVFIRNLCHALRVLLRNHTHPVAKATVKNQCFHKYLISYFLNSHSGCSFANSSYLYTFPQYRIVLPIQVPS